MRNPRTKRGFFRDPVGLTNFAYHCSFTFFDNKITSQHNNLPCFVHEKQVIMISNYVVFYQEKMCKQNNLWELHNGIVPLSSFL